MFSICKLYEYKMIYNELSNFLKLDKNIINFTPRHLLKLIGLVLKVLNSNRNQTNKQLKFMKCAINFSEENFVYKLISNMNPITKPYKSPLCDHIMNRFFFLIFECYESI